MPHIGVKKIQREQDILRKNPVFRFLGYPIRILVLLLFTPFFWFKYRLKVENKKALKAIRGKGAILVGNHCHALDCVLYSIKVFPRMNWITSIPENFRIPVAGTLAGLLGGIPIPYDLKGMRMFKQIIGELLRKKKLVTFYPEASLWPYYRSLRPFKTGAFRFAAQYNAPILPAAIAMRIRHRKNGEKKYRMRLVLLDPIYPDTTVPEPAAIEKLKSETFRAMQAVIESERERDRR